MISHPNRHFNILTEVNEMVNKCHCGERATVQYDARHKFGWFSNILLFNDMRPLEERTWNLSASARSILSHAIKRGIDILAATLLLIVLFPLLLVISIAIKLSSRGPVMIYSGPHRA